jgi:hypothetical protein
MANLLPGIRPIEQSSVAGGGTSRPTRRAQAPALDARQITSPTAAPVDTFVAPPRPSQDNPFLQLAGALQDFSPALRQIVEREADRGRQVMEAKAEGRIGGMTLQEANEAVSRGDMPEWSNPFFRAQFMRLYGERAGRDAALARVQQYETGFDKLNGNVDQFIAEGAQGGLGEFQDNPFYQQAFARTYGSIADRLRAQNVDDKTTQVKAESQDLVASQFFTIYDTLQSTGTYSPERLQQAFTSAISSNAQLNVLTKAQQDDLLAPFIQARADAGDVDTVRYLLTNDRGGVGALGKTRKYGARAGDWIEQAEANRIKANQKVQTGTLIDDNAAIDAGTYTPEMGQQRVDAGLITPAQMVANVSRSQENQRQAQERLAALQDKQEFRFRSQEAEQSAQGDAYQAFLQGITHAIRDVEIPNAEGTGTKTLSAEALKDYAVQQFYDQSDARAQRLAAEGKPLSVGEKAVYDASFFARAGLPDKRLQAALNEARMGITSAAIQAGTQDVTKLQAGLEAYMSVQASNAQYAATLVPEGDAGLFWEDMRKLTQYRRMDINQAAQTALLLQQNKGARNMPMGLDDYRAVDGAVSGALAQGWFHGDARNEGAVRFFISEEYRTGRALGLSQRDAAADAEKILKSSYTAVNGWLVPTFAKSYPPDLAQMLEERLEEVYKLLPSEAGISKENLRVLPQDDSVAGRWVIMNGFSPLPNANLTYVTLDDLLAVKRHKQEVAGDAAREAAVRRNQHKYDPLVVNSWLAIGPLPSLRTIMEGGFTKEEGAIIRQKIEEARANPDQRSSLQDYIKSIRPGSVPEESAPSWATKAIAPSTIGPAGGSGLNLGITGKPFGAASWGQQQDELDETDGR